VGWFLLRDNGWGHAILLQDKGSIVSAAAQEKRIRRKRFLPEIPVFLDRMSENTHNHRLSQHDLEMTGIRAQSRHFSATIGQQVKFKSQTWRKNEAPIKQNKGKSKCLISWKKLVWVVLPLWHP
jgi:hypothetical protein